MLSILPLAYSNFSRILQYFEQLPVVDKMTEEILKQGVGIVETSLTFEPPFCESFERISIDNFPIFALGKEISKEDGIEAMKKYVTSRFWFTYRRDFSPIGGTGPSTDQGWGCMLRCAQMLLGEVLLRRHIGRHFEWDIEKTSEIYEKILQMFFDEKDALYSIHQIAQMGVTEGKEVSKWFGPNTAAQVMKKLTIFDDWSNIAVHVALDNILVKEDAITMATSYPSEDAVKLIMENGLVDKNRLSLSPGNIIPEWRPLLLMIPLRLGLTTINPCYLSAIQEFFKIPQCVGIIGGRPNHALYFVGMSGSKLFYLDPHYCRPKTESTAKMYAEKDSTATTDDVGFSHLEELVPLPSQTADVYTKMDDSTYHCQMMLWIEYENVDPSLALAMFCETRDEFENLCETLQKTTLPASQPPMFEFLQRRPKYLPKFEPYTGVSMKIEMKEFDDIGAANVKIDDDFEVLDVHTEEEDADEDNDDDVANA
ncbi:Cysteine protease atg-4.1 [Caenorhabditis elegans]|uniref:Cysteine protease atg-4.1 n=2 Tax=Caenorhabditis elegans TaxID=6239 RepID=ATG41_CAEEL|nr:Cysteine protease atg-4.1 [Caenorhabditis elegans]K8ESC5.1 RecName: Full=Cysteine protease atg-4.1; AltName: Full=Autophagy-related protein 4 homolog 1 [Caenorhabditis elegans]CCO25637.1 Cysteine protease atg-4.1 [Caenorhabditis elegans]|eukprot:NP_001263575.1 Cysteine protease [Caenorhabditis elegans]